MSGKDPAVGKGYLTTLLSTSHALGGHSLAFFLGILVACFWGFLVTVITRTGTGTLDTPLNCIVHKTMQKADCRLPVSTWELKVRSGALE